MRLLRSAKWRAAASCVFFTVGLAGEAPAENADADADLRPLIPATTTSPRETLESFIEASNKIYALITENKAAGTVWEKFDENQHYFEQALGCLNLSGEAGFVRKSVGGRAAVCLKEILDRVPLPKMSAIPGDEEVKAAAEAGAPIESWRIPNTDISIDLVTEGPRAGEFLFSPTTVSRADQLYERVKSLPYKSEGATPLFYQWFLSEPGPWIAPLVRHLPASLRTKFIGDHALWQWIGFILSLVVAVLVMVGAYRMGRRVARAKRQERLVVYCLTILYPLLAMLIPILFGNFVRTQLRISGVTLVAVNFTSGLLFLFGTMVVIVGVANRIAEVIISNPKIQPKGLDAQLVRIVCRVLGLVAAVIVFLEGGKFLGIPLTTLLASAGVGGLAVALAAQDSLKNLFGTMMIILDKPYRIGERVSTKHYDGIVEEIGLRSTKIRLLNGHLASIPNEEMARSDIENIGRRPFIRRLTELRIPIHTPVSKVKRAVEIVREILADHEGMKPELPPRVHLKEFDSDALLIRVCYWYHPPEYWDFLAFSERVNLEIKTKFDAEGIEFALPTTVTEFKKAGLAPPPETG